MLPPMCLYSSFMKLWQNRITSKSDLPFGSKSDPPLPPPIGSVVRLFLRICSNPRNFRMPRLTVGWKRRPPLYGPMELENSTLNPRLTWIFPLSSSQGTRKMKIRSGSLIRSRILCSMYSGCFSRHGANDSTTSFTA